MSIKTTTASSDPRPWVNGQMANGRRFIPNVVVETNQGERKLFYDDLIKDRTVMIQFASIAGNADYPVTRNLKSVQRLLGDRCGRDIFLFTITSDPVQDTPSLFAEFAKQFSPEKGWTFLSGEPAAIEAVKQVFFVHGGIPDQERPANGVATQHSVGSQHDCSLGLIRYGNDGAGLWGSVPTKLDPQLIVQRMEWVAPSKVRKTLTRKGPVVRRS